MDLASKVEFLKFHQGYVRGVAFSPVVRFKVIKTELYITILKVLVLLSFYLSAKIVCGILLWSTRECRSYFSTSRIDTCFALVRMMGRSTSTVQRNVIFWGVIRYPVAGQPVICSWSDSLADKAKGRTAMSERMGTKTSHGGGEGKEARRKKETSWELPLSPPLPSTLSLTFLISPSLTLELPHKLGTG